MMQDSYLSLLKFILPTYILDHLELKSAQEKDADVLDIELEEPNVVPAEFGQGKYYSKGFYPKITIQDFPLRGHRVFFHIKRRRWMRMDGQEKGTLITRDWNVVSKGTRMTKEFAAFLKECRRYPTI
jgi:hypothetical protein